MAYTDNKKTNQLDTLNNTTLQDVDLAVIGDVTDSGRAKAITFVNLKSFFKTYFDTFYNVITNMTFGTTGVGFTASGGATSKTLTVSENTTLNGGTHSGTNTGDQTSIVGITGTKAEFDTACTDGNFLFVGDVTVPVKATGAEVDTGTNDDKFVTAKAIKDSNNVPSVAPGTLGNIMTSDGTKWVSQSLSSTATGYELLASADLSGGAATSISSGTFTAKKYLRIMFTTGTTSSGSITIRFNNDSGNNYDHNRARNFVVDGYSSNQAQIAIQTTNETEPGYVILDVNNFTNEDKRFTGRIIRDPDSLGDFWGRYEVVSSQITRVDFFCSSGNFPTNTYLEVYGMN